MSNFAVGALYSSQKFLHLVLDQEITDKAFNASYRRYEVAEADNVLRLVQQCGWVRIHHDGVLKLTERGVLLTGSTNPEMCLREQIADLIVIENPP